jgi:signal transduction histidine kinase
VLERTSIAIRDRHGFERAVPARGTMVLGRQTQCDVVLPDSMVSRTHLRIQHRDGGWWVEDLGSSHGTFHEDERITGMAWAPGSTIRLADGAYFLTLKAEAAVASEVNLQAILQTANLLTGEVELDDLLEQTMDRLLAITSTDRGFIMLPEQGDLVVKVQRNLGANMERDIHLSMSSVQKVFEQGEAVWIHNVGTDENLMAQKSVMDLQLKTILCLPLLVQGKRIGVVYLDSRRIVTEPVDRPTFEAIVSLCAIAIERTRLSAESLRNEVLAAVGQVSSSIVHDFKNGLFVIAGHAQLLGGISADPTIQRHVAQILGAVERLSQLSSDVLDYSKVRVPRCETVELPAYLGSIVEPLQVRAQEAQVRLACVGPACTANLDKHRFVRVIENLLANALDALAGQDGGEVVLQWGPREGGVEISVSDNGKGISRKVLKRIFDPFFTHGKAKGTGLGMATVKKIVEEHRGTIEVLSEEGEGTQVVLFLPAGAEDGSTGKHPVQREAQP